MDKIIEYVFANGENKEKESILIEGDQISEETNIKAYDRLFEEFINPNNWILVDIIKHNREE